MKINKISQSLIFCILFVMSHVHALDSTVNLGVIGLTHTHVHWIFESEKNKKFKIAGIVEPNIELAQRYSKQHGFSMDIVYPNMETLFASVDLDGVTAFGSIYEHLEVVEAAAPRGIHVMVEKPLAVSLVHANKMAELARKHDIHLLTNYETTWYPSNHKAYELLKRGRIGDLRKVVVSDGHKGPTKLGINSEFLDWLTDPALNGGGAITDFGCYGANLMTWLMEGEKPIAVTAVTHQLQPENNPKVEDDATIILQYPETKAIVQASWNWPIGRKDMQLYGLKGTISADNRHELRMRIAEGYDGYDETKLKLPERKAPMDDPFSLFGAVIKGEHKMGRTDLSSLENNLVVMEILDAAIRSAKEGRTVQLH